MPQDEVLRARGRADRVRLHEPEPPDRARERRRREEAARDRVATKILEPERSHAGIVLTFERMGALDELIEALNQSGLTWGKPATFGAPEVRVKNDAGQEFVVKVLRFSYNVSNEAEPFVMHQCLTPEDVLARMR